MFKIPSFLLTIFAFAGVFSLTACSGGAASIKDTLGVDVGAPDEFRVVRRAPLEIPEDLILRAPTPGADRPQEFTPIKQARNALTSNNETAQANTIEALATKGATSQATASQGRSEETSQGTLALLNEVGANDTPDDIRAIVDKETKKWDARNTPVIEKLGLVERGTSSGIRLNPTEEAVRLLKEQYAGTVVRPFGLDANTLEQENNE